MRPFNGTSACGADGASLCTGDPLSFDIFTQPSQALKVNVAPEALLPGLTVSNVIAVGQFSAPACSWAVEKQTQRWMYMGRASRHGRAMMDQRNQIRRRKKSLDPTHLHSVDGQFASLRDLRRRSR